jgi:ATP-dependent 26S proteasome regulatory subunit
MLEKLLRSWERPKSLSRYDDNSVAYGKHPIVVSNYNIVQVHPEGKYVVDIGSDIDISTLTPTVRVALRNDSYQLHKVLPNKVDPLVSLMMVEKVPDSTYEMVGGLEKQIKEIKEVIELPVKHPELFESLGIAQPKGVLLYGPPGTGKTLLARAVAHHTDCRFIRVSGSELVQKYIGEGSRMVRELFVMARYVTYIIYSVINSASHLRYLQTLQRACTINHIHGRNRLNWFVPYREQWWW